jgi:hypothetical protein
MSNGLSLESAEICVHLRTIRLPAVQGGPNPFGFHYRPSSAFSAVICIPLMIDLQSQQKFVSRFSQIDADERQEPG